MPNLGAVLKAEIARLSRREVKALIEATAKVSTQHRKYIAGLKRQVAKLEHDVARLHKRLGPASNEQLSVAGGAALRFVAKGFRSHRNRLGLSAAEYGKLLGVSAQSIYNWERNVSVPRKEQLMRIAALRSLGKREAKARLEHLRAN